VWLVPWLLASKEQWKAHSSPKGHTIGLRDVLRQPTVWSMGIGHFMNTYGFYFLLAWLPLFLVKMRGISILEMTAMTTVAYVVQGCGALFWGWWSDRAVRGGADEGRVRKGLMSLYLAITAIAILGIGFSISPAAIFAWLIVNALFAGIGGANCYAISQIYAGPEAAGRWVGVMNGLGNTSGIVGPILTGVLIQRTGSYMAAFAVSAAIVAVGAFWWWFALPRVRQLSFTDSRMAPQPA
jgi:sugar phosphate permease